MKEMLGDYPVRQTQQLIWGDMDAFEHINNKVYFRYFEDIRIEFMRQTGIIEHMAQTQLGPILASTHCDFRVPLVFPDTIHIGARVTEMGEKKFAMQYLVVSEKLACAAAEGSGLVVYYDFKQARSCPIPATIVAAIELLKG